MIKKLKFKEWLGTKYKNMTNSELARAYRYYLLYRAAHGKDS